MSEQTGRPGRTTGSSPMGSTVAIIVAIAAVVIGFLILREVRKTDPPAKAVTVATTQPVTPTVDVAATTLPLVTAAPTEAPTTVFVPVTTGTKVQVANASGQNGVAKILTTALKGEKFDMADPTNSTQTKQEVSKVLYDPANPAAAGVAASVAQLMGGVAVEQIGLPLPTKTGAWPADTAVLVLLGNDKAGKTLAQMNGATTATTVAGATATTIAPVTT